MPIGSFYCRQHLSRLLLTNVICLGQFRDFVEEVVEEPVVSGSLRLGTLEKEEWVPIGSFYR